MPHNPDTNDNQNNPDTKIERIIRWSILIGTPLAILGIIFASSYLGTRAERAQFITINVLSVCVLDVIALQAYIYRRQWRAMQEALSLTIEGIRPRLAITVAGRRLADNDVIELEISFSNAGASDATNVTLEQPTLHIGTRPVALTHFQPRELSVARGVKETMTVDFESPTADEVTRLHATHTSMHPDEKLYATFAVKGIYNGMGSTDTKPYTFEALLTYGGTGNWRKADITDRR